MESRERILLKAAYDLLKQCEESPTVLNPLAVVVEYDDAACDGMCLLTDIETLLDIEEK